MIYLFESFEADEELFELRRSGVALPVQRLILDTIFFMLHDRTRLITTPDLIGGPWKGTAVMVNFLWPHRSKTGMTAEMAKQLTTLVQKIWPKTG